MTDIPHPPVNAASSEPWSGTLAQLSAATGMSGREIIDAIRNRRQDLRKAGIDVAIQLSPAGPAKIRIFEVEPEQLPEPATEPDVTLPKPPEQKSNPPVTEERQEARLEPAPEPDVSLP